MSGKATTYLRALILAATALLMEPLTVHAQQIHTAPAATIYVDATALGAPDGLDWATAFTDLQDALKLAKSAAYLNVGGVPAQKPVQIWVAAGSYAVDAGDLTGTSGACQAAAADCTFEMVDNLAVYGGFAGNETPGSFDLSSRDFSLSETILTGALSTTTGNAKSVVGCTWVLGCTASFSLIDVVAGNTSAEIDGVTITAGAGGTGGYGAGVYVDTGNLYIAKATIENNTATTGGGGLFVDGICDVLVDASSIQNNDSDLNGAGVFSSVAPGNTLTFRNSILAKNNAANAGGAGYANDTGSLVLLNSTIEGNAAGAIGGGGLWIDNTAAITVDIDNSLFYNNAFAGTPHSSLDVTGAVGTITVDDSMLGQAACDANATCANTLYATNPLFVNPSLLDYHLQAGSLAINSGDNAAAAGISEDYAGLQRVYPTGGNVDMGAHEAAIDLDYGDLPTGGPDYSAVTVLPNDAARHQITGPVLGAAVTADSDGQPTASADGDADDGAVFSTLIKGATGNVQLYLSGASLAYANVWIDLDNGTGTGSADGDFTNGADIKLVDQLIYPGHNVLPFVVPAGIATATAFARIRVTSATGTSASTGFAGYMADGEVEDYAVPILAAAPATVTVPTPKGGATVSYNGTTLTVTDAGGTTIYSGPPGTVDNDIDGSAGNDVFTIDGPLDEDIVFNFDGGSGGTDSIVLASTTTPSPIDQVDFQYADETDGYIEIDATGGATVYRVNYENFDPIIDNTTAATKTFTYATAGTITLNADGDGAADNGYSWIDCDGCGEATSFKNPTAALVVTTNGVGVTMNLGLLDTSSATAPAATVTANGGAGGDVFVVTPTPSAGGWGAIAVNGGAPAVCPADVLHIDPAAGATVLSYSPTPLTFSSSHASIAYSGIEAVGEADLAITSSATTLYATDVMEGDRALEITVTNNGPDDASCVLVTLDPALSTYFESPDVSGYGSFLDPEWDIGTLPAGVSVTLTVEGFVTTNVDRTVSFTAAAGEDLSTGNNTVTVGLTMGFQFPAKAQINSAVYVEQNLTVGSTTYLPFDQLIVGLFQGAPGQEGAVWCKLPALIDTDGVEATTGDNIWPPAPLTSAAMPNLWRPCSTGLPYPLHVNDFFEDSSGTLWMPVWGYAGLYKSDDAGQTWEQANPDPSCVIIYAITEDAANILYISVNNGLVFRSLDGGTIWQQVGSLPHVAADTPWSLTAHPSIPGTVYAGLFGKGVYVSEDFGLTWAALGGDAENNVLIGNKDLTAPDADNPNSLNAGYIFDLEFAPNNDCATTATQCFLFAGTSKGVWRADVATPTTAPAWALMGPVVTFDAVPPVTCTVDSTDGACAIPEVRTLAFDASSGNLFIGTWGFDAFVDTTPNGAIDGTTDNFAELALKISHVTFVAVAADGSLTVGGNDGGMATFTFETAMATPVEAPAIDLPSAYALDQNYPNPFNPVTTIAFAVPETARLRLAIYDVLGREVALLVDGTIEAGHHEVRFDASGLPSGTYLYRLQSPQGATTRLLTLMK